MQVLRVTLEMKGAKFDLPYIVCRKRVTLHKKKYRRNHTKERASAVVAVFFLLRLGHGDASQHATSSAGPCNSYFATHVLQCVTINRRPTTPHCCAFCYYAQRVPSRPMRNPQVLLHSHTQLCMRRTWVSFGCRQRMCEAFEQSMPSQRSSWL